MPRLNRLWLIFAAALALRVGFAAAYVLSHPPRALSTIPFLFEPGNIAYSLATGHGFGSPFRVDTGPTAWMTPLYPLLLAGIFRIFGTYTLNAYLAAVGLNILFSTLTCIPIFQAGKRIGGASLAILAASLWAIFPNAIILPYESLWDASLSALLAATILWATLAVADSKKQSRWTLYGLLWGVALMTNAALISLLPFLLFWAGYRAPRRGQLAAAVILLCCIPWTIRNYRVFHTFVPLRSVGGLALWIGNNDQAQSLTPGRQHPISNQAEREKYIEQGEIAYMREKQGQAVAYILSHPAAECRLIAGRFTSLWTGGSAHLLNDFRNARTARFYLVTAFNLGAAFAALAGIIFLWHSKSPYLFPAAVYPVVFPLVYYLALAPPRYRHPIDPVLLLLAAIALSHLPNYKKRPSPAAAP